MGRVCGLTLWSSYQSTKQNKETAHILEWWFWWYGGGMWSGVQMPHPAQQDESAGETVNDAFWYYQEMSSFPYPWTEEDIMHMDQRPSSWQVWLFNPFGASINLVPVK